jgi:hypothetical protein
MWIVILMAAILAIVVHAQRCVPCPKIKPVCACPVGTKCIDIPQTCQSCARVECVTDDIVEKQTLEEQGEWVICPLMMPSCAECEAQGKQCVIQRRTCKQCAYAECLDDVPLKG